MWWKGCCDHEIALKLDVAREREILSVICCNVFMGHRKKAEVSNGSMIAIIFMIEHKIVEKSSVEIHNLCLSGRLVTF